MLKNLNFHHLHDRIILERAMKEQDGIGGCEVRWIKFAKIWCNILDINNKLSKFQDKIYYRPYYKIITRKQNINLLINIHYLRLLYKKVIIAVDRVNTKHSNYIVIYGTKIF